MRERKKSNERKREILRKKRRGERESKPKDVGDVCVEVAVDEAEGRLKEREADGDGSFVAHYTQNACKDRDREEPNIGERMCSCSLSLSYSPSSCISHSLRISLPWVCLVSFSFSCHILDLSLLTCSCEFSLYVFHEWRVYCACVHQDEHAH